MKASTTFNTPQVNRQTFNEVELADRWGLSPKTLQRWRVAGVGPQFMRLGGRVLYRVVDIEEYEERSLRLSTSESARAREGM